MDLRVEKQKRVFVGGQYDFMPTLRFIGEVVKECGFLPIIPYDDARIQVHETMDQDIAILETCDLAIFDLSDLGAQLVEMQVAKMRGKTMLLVYPVRERRCEPERGKRTILSFEKAHFGYLTFEELRSVIWRFLRGSGIALDYPSPRAVRDRDLDLMLRTVKALQQQADYSGAEKVLQSAIPPYSLSLELELESALTKFQLKQPGYEDVLSKAEKQCQDERDLAEISLYRAAMAGNLGEAARLLNQVTTLLPNDGRGLMMLGYVKGMQALPEKDRMNIDAAALKEAIRLLKCVVDGSKTAAGRIDISDPIVAINAINNLAYFSCCEYDFPDPGTTPNGADPDVLRKLQEMLVLTQDLEAWHNLFARQEPAWLDTRGFMVLLIAEATRDAKRAEDALRILGKAPRLKDDPFTARHYRRAMGLRDKLGG